MSALSEPAALLSSRTVSLDDAPDLVAALGVDGFAWLHDGAGLATAGVAARIRVRRGGGRLDDAAADVAGLLGGISDDDPLRIPGSGPIAVGALGFADDADAELIVPAVVVGLHPPGPGVDDHDRAGRPGIRPGRRRGGGRCGRRGR